MDAQEKVELKDKQLSELLVSRQAESDSGISTNTRESSTSQPLKKGSEDNTVLDNDSCHSFQFLQLCFLLTTTSPPGMTKQMVRQTCACDVRHRRDSKRLLRRLKKIIHRFLNRFRQTFIVAAVSSQLRTFPAILLQSYTPSPYLPVFCVEKN